MTCTTTETQSAPTTLEPEAIMGSPLSDKELALIDAYWRAANYLSVGQVYLYDNPLLKKPLTKEHIKPRLLGHWGTTPGLNFIYAHLNRVIKKYDLKSGARTTTASATRTRVSSTTSSTRRPRSSACTCRRTPAVCSPSPTTACGAATT
jgi:hypothetical protein